MTREGQRQAQRAAAAGRRRELRHRAVRRQDVERRQARRVVRTLRAAWGVAS